jgi:hypothetical protein
VTSDRQTVTGPADLTPCAWQLPVTFRFPIPQRSRWLGRFRFELSPAIAHPFASSGGVTETTRVRLGVHRQ